MFENLKVSRGNDLNYPARYSKLLLRIPRRPILVYQSRDRILSRVEEWGSIVYDFKRDNFSAKTRNLSFRIKPEPPLSIYWLVVAPCNLRCVHCYGNVEEMPRES